MKRNVKILSRDRSWKKASILQRKNKKSTLTDGLPNTVLLREEIFRLVHKREMRRNPEEQKNREKKTKREILEWGSEKGGREGGRKRKKITRNLGKKRTVTDFRGRATANDITLFFCSRYLFPISPIKREKNDFAKATAEHCSELLQS